MVDVFKHFRSCLKSYLGESLDDGLQSSINWDVDLEVGDLDSAEVGNMTSDSRDGAWSINKDLKTTYINFPLHNSFQSSRSTYSVLVEDVNNNSELAVVTSVGNQNHAADFNEAIEQLDEG